MKRTNIFLFAGLVMVTAAACSKMENIPAEEALGIPVTISATIGDGIDTKATYTPDGNILKTAWEASETITAITLDGSGNVVTVDNLTYSGPAGKKTVDFTGTLSSGATSNIRVFYPALEATPYETDTYGTPIPDGKTSNSARYIHNVIIGKRTITFSSYDSTQSADGSTDHLKQAFLYEGTGTLSGSTLSVSLTPLSSVLKVTFTLPAEAVGKQVSGGIYITIKDATDASYNFDPSSQWFYYFSGTPLPNATPQMRIYLGSWTGTTQNCLMLSSTTFVAYIPFIPTPGAKFGPDGGKIFEISFGESSSPTKWKKSTTKTLTGSNVDLAPGKIYRMSVDLTL